jgi:hypothetical protein
MIPYTACYMQYMESTQIIILLPTKLILSEKIHSVGNTLFLPYTTLILLGKVGAIHDYKDAKTT